MSSRLITPSLVEFPNFLKKIESKWSSKLRKRFERERYVADKKRSVDGCKSTKYILSMFPYPSGRLHLGHVRIYTSSDILARYSKLMCKNERLELDYTQVIHPMGFDSFGLPAENAAKERKMNPAVWTNSNIRTMKQQLDDLALQFDWREATSNRNFYKWTQEIFLKLMNAGLVYKSFAQVNWDPIDKTVLADEQVDEDGRSWRSGALVEKRFYRQWFVKVNSFTKAIYDAEDVDPETWLDILAIQRNWIGKPTGWLFYLPVTFADSKADDILTVFTAKPELLHELDTELELAADHWLHQLLNVSEIRNPFTNQSMKVKISQDPNSLPSSTKATLKNDQKFNLPLDQLKLNRQQVLLQARLRNLGGYFTSDKYRDWLISRQRFWGTPIPVTHCDDCGYRGVNPKDLPVALPFVESLAINSDLDRDSLNDLRIITPIEKHAPFSWLNTKCQSCGKSAKRECETFDTLFDSSWYFLRYATEPTNDRPFDKERVQPVACYVGGKEHASMHLFYARFVTHFLHSIGELDFKEPFKNLLVQGVVKRKTYKLNGKYIEQSDAESLSSKIGLEVAFEKMSKSKGNGVDPQELLDTYGIDATRLCLMSYANPKSERLWRTNSEEFKDVLIYMRRVTLTVQQYVDIGVSPLENKVKNTIKDLSISDLECLKLFLADTRNKCSIDATFNLAETYQFRQYISILHVLTNALRKNIFNSSVFTKEFAEALASLIIMLNPIVPHLSEELWIHFSNSAVNPLRMDQKSPFKLSMQVSDQAWPIPDQDFGRSQCVKPLKNI